LIRKDDTSGHYVRASRWSTFFWGVFCIIVAQFASRLGSMIEAVNVLVSLLYGVILGIFLVAFYFKSIGYMSGFIGAIIGEMFVVYSFMVELTVFLWLNLIGCVMVIVFALLAQKLWPEKQNRQLLLTDW